MCRLPALSAYHRLAFPGPGCTIFFLPLKNFIRLVICPIERIIIRNPNLPCTPPIEEWVNVVTQWIIATTPLTRVTSATHHRIRVTWLFCFLNLENRLLLPKCRYTWYAAIPINSTPIKIWIHTDGKPMLWVASSCIPDIRIAIVRARRHQLPIFNFVIFSFCSLLVSRFEYRHGTWVYSFLYFQPCRCARHTTFR